MKILGSNLVPPFGTDGLILGPCLTDYEQKNGFPLLYPTRLLSQRLKRFRVTVSQSPSENPPPQKKPDHPMLGRNDNFPIQDCLVRSDIPDSISIAYLLRDVCLCISVVRSRERNDKLGKVLEQKCPSIMMMNKGLSSSEHALGCRNTVTLTYQPHHAKISPQVLVVVIHNFDQKLLA